jgi:hypothetical protein
VDNPNHKGNVAELAIATEAARLGLAMLKPLTEHESYDLVIGLAGRLLRVQCKWAQRKGDVVLVNLARSRRGPKGQVRRNYTAAEVDAIGAYCCGARLLFHDSDRSGRLTLGYPASSGADPEMGSAPHYTSRASISSGL